jgi:hypothetical protein
VIDAVRLAARTEQRRRRSPVGPSSYLMKSPPQQIVDDEAYNLTEKFIEQDRRKAVAAPHPRPSSSGHDTPRVRPRGVSLTGLPAHNTRMLDGIRVALVTPSLVAAASTNTSRARRSCAREGSVTVLAPSNRPRDLAEGRRARARR